MTTLVTGVTGLLGNNVLRLLVDRGQPVRALVRGASDPRPLAGLDVECVAGDVSDPASLARAMQGVDRVVHSAGFVQIGWSGLEKGRAINVGGAKNVAQAARAARARLVHVSTINTLGLGRPDQPADEDAPYGAANIKCTYVVTKREAELAVLAEVEQGLHAALVNPGFMLGPWDWKPSSGRMMLEVARRSPPISPRGGVSVCDVRDVAAAILAALDHGQPGRRYILGGRNMLYFDLWTDMAKVTGGKPPKFRPGPVMPYIAGKFGDLWSKLRGVEADVNSAATALSSQYHYYTSRRAQQELGYESRPVETSIADAWQWFKEYGYV